jgi:drug/metabolite transporter (DMT)-like permease
VPWASTYGPLLVAVVAVSFGSILVRLADAPAAAVAFYRMAFAAALLAPVALRGGLGAWPALSRRSRLFVAASGLALALHFATWIASLTYTSVSASVLLVNTAPLVTLVLSWVFLREAPASDLVAALLLALGGIALVATDDSGPRAPALKGDLLALAGAASLSAHHVLGRGLRATLPLGPYVLSVWSVAAAALGLFALVSGTSLTGISRHSLLFLVALAVVPTLIGHGLVNRSLRVLPATAVGLFLLGEPVGASALAYAFFHEVPSARVFGGGALILAGLTWLVVRGRG